MTAEQIRERFLSFFSKAGHQLLPPAAIVSTDDPTVLFTTAGMQPLKPFFLGSRDPVQDLGSRRLASVQPCLRTTDIESVGDASHLTFFEMLGNFSVGDYGKIEAIRLAWEFLTDALSIDLSKLWVTYFSGEGELKPDQETAKAWEKHLSRERIRGFGRGENWWGPPGPSGPCGPSTEIHVDRRGTPCERGEACKPNCPCDRFLELWNIVIMEFHQSSEGQFTPLPTKNIDTGMGLERLAMVLQKGNTVFETDLFRSLQTIRQDDAFGTEGEPTDTLRSRVVADHVKGITFLLGSGVNFSNKDHGYVLRRLFRRAVDQFRSPRASLAPFLDAVIDHYGKRYPELAQRRPSIHEAAERERRAYEKVLNLEVKSTVFKFLRKPPAAQPPEGPSHIKLTGPEVFNVYSTMGISPDRLRREGFEFDQAELEKQIAEHQARSREHSKSKFGGHGLTAAGSAEYTPEELQQMKRLHTATHLLHAALRQTLGDHVRQQGSEISPERLRFDFEHPLKLTESEKRSVENLVNEQIQSDLPVSVQEMPYDEAIRAGALAFFKEKYPDRVTVYSVGNFSKELCSGPHVSRTGELGTFRIISERSAAAGIRRIKAVVDRPTDPAS